MIYVYYIYIFFVGVAMSTEMIPSPAPSPASSSASSPAPSPASSPAPSSAPSCSSNSSNYELRKGFNGLDKVLLRDARGSSAEVAFLLILPCICISSSVWVMSVIVSHPL